MDHTADKLALLTPLQTRGAFTAANCRRGRVGIPSHLILLWRRYCTGSLHVITFFQSLLTPSMAWHPAIIAAVQIWINNHCQNRQSESLYVKYPSLFCLFMWTSSLGPQFKKSEYPYAGARLWHDNKSCKKVWYQLKVGVSWFLTFNLTLFSHTDGHTIVHL